MASKAPRSSADISTEMHRQEEAFRRRTPEQAMGERILTYMKNTAIAVSLVFPAMGAMLVSKRPGADLYSGVQQGIEAKETPGSNQNEKPQDQIIAKSKEKTTSGDGTQHASRK